MQKVALFDLQQNATNYSADSLVAAYFKQRATSTSWGSLKELHRRAGVFSPAAEITRRTLKFVGGILAGPPQVAKTLLKWQHNYTRRRQYKRRLSYPEQIRHITREREALSVMAKKARHELVVILLE